MSTFKHIDHSQPANIGDVKFDAILPPQVDVDFDFDRFEALMVELTAAVRSGNFGGRDVWKPLVPEIRIMPSEAKPPTIHVTTPAPLIRIAVPTWPLVVAAAIPSVVLAIDVLVRIMHWVR